jgi:tetratricopeptide (TPR) repeat protein
LPILAHCLNNLGGLLSDLGFPADALHKVTEAVTIQRELVGGEPDAFGPKLALYLANLATILYKIGRSEDSLSVSEEAVKSLEPSFTALPAAFAHQMGPICQQYVQRCKKVGREPDVELLAPIAGVLQRMQQASESDTS